MALLVTPLENWRSILWREAYHCGDEQFAERLIALATRFDRGDSEVGVEEDLVVHHASPFSVRRGLLGMGSFLFSCFLIGPRLSEAWYRGVWGLWCLGILMGAYLSFIVGWTGQFWLGDVKRLLLIWAERRYHYSRAAFAKRPDADEIEAALQQALPSAPSQAHIWQPLLARLQTARQTPASAVALRQGLESATWSERFLARHQLATSTGQILTTLQGHNSLPQKTLTWLRKNIETHENR